MVAFANTVLIITVLVVYACFTGSAASYLFTSKFGTRKSSFSSGYTSPFHARETPPYCFEAISSKECDICAECSLDQSTCEAYFKSSACWPAPKEDVCMHCFEEFGPSLFPKRLSVRTVLASRSYGTRFRSSNRGLTRMVSPAQCESLEQTGTCDICKKCMGDGTRFAECKKMFTTDKCWPAPTQPECFKCYSEFEDAIFPK